MRPLCFGLPSIISFTSPTCKACDYLETCKVDALGVLKGLSRSIDVSGDIVRFTQAMGAPDSSVDANVILTLEALPEVVSGADKVKSKTLTPEDTQRVEAMPVKARQKMRMLIKKGIDKTAKSDFLKGLNPFSLDSHRYLHVACQLLLMNGRTTKKELVEELQKQMGWSAGTAVSHAASIYVLFDAIGISKVSDGIIVPTIKES